MKKVYLYLIAAILSVANLTAQDGTEANYRKWALTPPLGWNSIDSKTR